MVTYDTLISSKNSTNIFYFLRKETTYTYDRYDDDDNNINNNNNNNSIQAGKLIFFVLFFRCQSSFSI